MREVTAHARGYGDKSINLWWPNMQIWWFWPRMGISEINMIGMINKVGGFEDPKHFPILTPSSPIPTIIKGKMEKYFFACIIF